MPYLQIINAYGSVQIDDTYKNPRLYSAFSDTTNTAMLYQYFALGPTPPPAPPNLLAGSYKTFTLSRASVPNPTIAVYSTSAHVCVSNLRYDASNWYYTVRCDGAVGTGFLIHIYTAASSPAGSFGLEAYRADGSMLFDALQKYIRTDRNVIVPSSGNLAFANYNLEAGRTYGIMTSMEHISYVQDTFSYGGNTFYRLTYKAIGSQAYSGGHNAGSFPISVQVQPTGPLTPTITPLGGPIFPVDITNY